MNEWTTKVWESKILRQVSIKLGTKDGELELCSLYHQDDTFDVEN